MRNWFGVRGAGQDAEGRRARSQAAWARAAKELDELVPRGAFSPFMTEDELLAARDAAQNSRVTDLVNDVIRRRQGILPDRSSTALRSGTQLPIHASRYACTPPDADRMRTPPGIPGRMDGGLRGFGALPDAGERGVRQRRGMGCKKACQSDNKER